MKLLLLILIGGTVLGSIYRDRGTFEEDRFKRNCGYAKLISSRIEIILPQGREYGYVNAFVGFAQFTDTTLATAKMLTVRNTAKNKLVIKSTAASDTATIAWFTVGIADSITRGRK